MRDTNGLNASANNYFQVAQCDYLAELRGGTSIKTLQNDLWDVVAADFAVAVSGVTAPPTALFTVPTAVLATANFIYDGYQYLSGN